MITTMDVDEAEGQIETVSIELSTYELLVLKQVLEHSKNCAFVYRPTGHKRSMKTVANVMIKEINKYVKENHIVDFR